MGGLFCQRDLITALFWSLGLLVCDHIVPFLGIKSLGIIDGKASMAVNLQPPDVVEPFSLVGKLNI